MKKTWLSPVLVCTTFLLLNCGSVFAGAILVSFYQPASPPPTARNATTPATQAQFVTGLHATGGLATEILGSTVTGINIGPFHTYGPFHGGGITITPSVPHTQFAYPTQGQNATGPLTDSIVTQAATGVVDTIQGLSLSPNTQYVFDVFATPLFGSTPATTTEVIEFQYAGGTPEYSAPLSFGEFASFKFSTGAGPIGDIKLTLTGPGPFTPSGEYLGIGSFAALPVPEPSSMMLLGMGGLVLGAYRRFQSTVA